MAGTYDITIEQGATFRRILTWRDGNGVAVNLTGWTARLQMRRSLTASSPFLELNTESGGLVLGGSAGTIEIVISAEATAALDQKHGVYDLEMVSGSGEVTRLLQGRVTLDREATR
jgi:hypothetical protein